MEVEIGLMLAIFCPLLSSLILYKVRRRVKNNKQKRRKFQKLLFNWIFEEKVRIARKRKIPRESSSEGNARHMNAK
ncbi:MAG: hypothetical protein ACOXZ3_08650 [Synergistaceae bacterium]|jgi:di/tricarboxylate transporter